MAAIGYNLKPTTAFAFIAILAVYVLERLLARQDARAAARAILAVLLSAVLGFGAAYIAIRADIASRPYAGPQVIKNDEAVPLTHFLAMGATGHEGYSRADIQATRAIADPQERFRHGIDLYVERVGAMGYPGYLQFLAEKASWTFGDGSFYSWGEGGLREQENPFPVHDRVSSKVQSYLWINGEKFPLTAGVWQSAWLALLVLVVVPLWVRSPRLMSSNAAIMRWALLALTLFLLLFETRSRYLYLYLPFFILLSTLKVDALGKRHPSFVTEKQPVIPSARDDGTPIHGVGASGR